MTLLKEEMCSSILHLIYFESANKHAFFIPSLSSTYWYCTWKQHRLAVNYVKLGLTDHQFWSPCVTASLSCSGLNCWAIALPSGLSTPAILQYTGHWFKQGMSWRILSSGLLDNLSIPVSHIGLVVRFSELKLHGLHFTVGFEWLSPNVRLLESLCKFSVQENERQQAQEAAIVKRAAVLLPPEPTPAPVTIFAQLVPVGEEAGVYRRRQAWICYQRSRRCCQSWSSIFYFCCCQRPEWNVCSRCCQSHEEN